MAAATAGNGVKPKTACSTPSVLLNSVCMGAGCRSTPDDGRGLSDAPSDFWPAEPPHAPLTHRTPDTNVSQREEIPERYFQAAGGPPMTEDAADRTTDGRRVPGPSRRQLGRRALALGGALALAPFPAGPASAAPRTTHRTLRHGSPERAGLLPAPLRRLVTDAETFLGPSPDHPWYAGAVLLAGRGGTVALHQPIGTAVRYRAYDEKTDTGVEFPADRADPHGRGHRLRPRLGVEAVHLPPRRAADRAGRAGAGGEGRRVPPGVRRARASRT